VREGEPSWTLAATCRRLTEDLSFSPADCERPITELTGRHQVADVRIPATAYIGTTSWPTFHVDIAGSEVRMTGEPEDVPPLLGKAACERAWTEGAQPSLEHALGVAYRILGADSRPSTPCSASCPV
jgi:hypothetical protein